MHQKPLNLVKIWSNSYQIWSKKVYKLDLVGVVFFCYFHPQAFVLLAFGFDVLACPARFERATYALEALKMRLNNNLNNDIKVLVFGVA